MPKGVVNACYVIVSIDRRTWVEMYELATIGPSWSVLYVAPCRRLMVMVPVTSLGSQTISKDDPAGMFWS